MDRGKLLKGFVDRKQSLIVRCYNRNLDRIQAYVVGFGTPL